MSAWLSIPLLASGPIGLGVTAVAVVSAAGIAFTLENRDDPAGVAIGFTGALLLVTGTVGYFTSVWPDVYLPAFLSGLGIERTVGREGVLLGLALLGRGNLLDGVQKVFTMARGRAPQSDHHFEDADIEYEDSDPDVDEDDDRGKGRPTATGSSPD